MQALVLARKRVHAGLQDSADERWSVKYGLVILRMVESIERITSTRHLTPARPRLCSDMPSSEDMPRNHVICFIHIVRSAGPIRSRADKTILGCRILRDFATTFGHPSPRLRSGPKGIIMVNNLLNASRQIDSKYFYW